MKRAIRTHYKDFLAIIGLVVLALAVSFYVLRHERFRFPFIDEQPIHYNAEFSTAQAVTPGQGQTVRISGVQVGEIGKVTLKDGKAVVEMDVEPKYKNVIHSDWTALLRPKTGLKDMYVELSPPIGGSKAQALPPGGTIPVSNTQPDVNPDEIYAALDGDTRAYLQLLVNGAGQGLKGRGNDLADLFRRFEPTHRDIARVTQAVAQRRQNLRRLINSLAILNHALTEKKTDLSSLVTTSSKVFHAFATEDANIQTSLRDLPGTLRVTTTTLGKVQRFAEILRPAATELIPVARAIPPANHALVDLAPVATPIIRDQIRPFIRDARPLVRALKPAAQNLSAATPHLRTSFTVLNHLFNTLAYNPRGREAVNVPGRQEGFLFWIAWLDHQALTVFNAQDAHGTFRQLFLQASCSTLKQIATEQAGAEFALNLTPIFNSPFCKTNGGGSPLPLP